MNEVCLIAAIARDRVVGRKGGLPWSAPEDLRRFRGLTLGHAVIMGERTWAGLGRPLPHRQNIVLSTRSEATVGAQRAESLADALDLVESGSTAWVIGGKRPWREAMPIAAAIYLTVIRRVYEGDTHFPRMNPVDWETGERIDTEAMVDGTRCRVTYLRLDRVGRNG